MYDLIIVGAGPCGLACAAEARRAGLNYVAIEKGSVAHALTNYPTYMRFFSTPELLEIAGVPFITESDHPTRAEALRYYRSVAGRFELNVHTYEEVLAVDRIGGGASGLPAGDGLAGRPATDAARFVVRTRDRLGRPHEYRACAVAIAVGYFDHPNRIGVPGEELPHVTHLYREAHPYFGQRVVVVGGRNSAVETALELHRSGARVTLVHRGPGLSDRVKPWILPDITNRIKNGEIRAVFGARVRRIRPDAVELEPADGGRPPVPHAAGGNRPDGEQPTVAGDQPRTFAGVPAEVPCDFVVLQTGYRLDREFLERCGVRIDAATGKPAHDEETMESNVPGLYICGVIAAGYDANKVFIENGRLHGARIVTHLAASAPGPRRRG